ncbi:MAG TPA: hypothetical protein DCG18_00550 [Richelia sp.]|nr:hypothetical protein [Richelia sp.]
MGSYRRLFINQIPWEVNILGFLVCLEGVDKVKKYEEITKEKIVDSNLITEILVGRLPNG